MEEICLITNQLFEIDRKVFESNLGSENSQSILVENLTEKLQNTEPILLEITMSLKEIKDHTSQMRQFLPCSKQNTVSLQRAVPVLFER